MPDQLFEKLIRPRTLLAGWHLTRRDVVRDFYLDDFGLECFASNLPSHIQEISRTPKGGEYRFAQREPIAIPKGPYGTRPGSIIAIRDRIVLWAIVAIIAPKLDARLSTGVRSFRLQNNSTSGNMFEEMDELPIPFLKSSYISRNISPFSQWQYNWKKFDDLSKEAFNRGYRYLAITDISAYFENINIDLLRDLIFESFPTEQKTIHLLHEALCSWVVRTSRGHAPHRGIPQGTGISSFLGNMFLIPVDDAISGRSWNHDTIYLRYMDDIRVFSRTKPIAAKALLTLEQTLRESHLSVQTAKTKVLGPSEVKDILFDERINSIIEIRSKYKRNQNSNAAISKLIKVGNHRSGSAEPIAKKFTSRSGLLERATRMWMNSLMYYGSTAFMPYLSHAVLKNSDPRYSEIFSRAAKAFPKYTFPRTAIYSYLDSPDNLFEYQECHFIEAFRYMNLRSLIMKRRCFSRLRDGYSYNIKLAAIRYLAKWRLTRTELLEIIRLQRIENNLPCRIAYLQILAQLNSIDFFNVVLQIGRIPSASAVDAVEFVRKAQHDNSFSRSFLRFVFNTRFAFRLSDWIGVIWIMSHSSNNKFKRHLDGHLRRRELVENDNLLRESIRTIRGDLYD